MIETQDATKVATDSADGVNEMPAAAEGATTDTLDETTGAVGTFVGMLTGGFVIAAAAGFVAGFVTGIAVARLAAPTPPPRWQMWR